MHKPQMHHFPADLDLQPPKKEAHSRLMARRADLSSVKARLPGALTLALVLHQRQLKLGGGEQELRAGLAALVWSGG